VYFALGDAENCYEVLKYSDQSVKGNRRNEAAIFARTYLPSKLEEATAIWTESVKGKPYSPISYTEQPQQKPVINLAEKVESQVQKYSENDREQASDYEAALTRHFSEIALEVDAGEPTSLEKALSQF